MPIPRRYLFLLGAPLSAFAQDTSIPVEDPKLVLDMVGASHGNVKRVRELIDAHPSLVRATLDWGFGDWETALGAASHVGNREIAELLLDRGAEPTIFSAAMLGQLEVVQAMVKAKPGLQRLRGPHGIPLLAHAKAGGEKSAEVAKFLSALGDAGMALPTQPLSTEDRNSVVGKYVFGPGERDYFEVDVVKEQLGILRPGAPARRLLFHAGNLVFFPSGAPWAQITFEREAGRVTSLTLGQIRARRS